MPFSVLLHGKQGLAALQEAIKLSPQNEEYLNIIRMAMFNVGNWEEAEKYEQLALQADQENPITC